MPDDTPIFDALTIEYARAHGHALRINGITYPYIPRGIPKPILDRWRALRDSDPARNWNANPNGTYGTTNGNGHKYTYPVYEYPERPADVPSYTVGHAHSYPYVTRDGRRKAVSITGDEHAVLRVEPFWSE